jgi:hypothetical protein
MRDGQSNVPALADRPWLAPADLEDTGSRNALVVVLPSGPLARQPSRSRTLVPLRRDYVVPSPQTAPARRLVHIASWLLVPMAAYGVWFALPGPAPAPPARPSSVEIELPPLPPLRPPAAPPAARAPAPVVTAPEPPAPPVVAEPREEVPPQPLAIDTLPAAEAAVRMAIDTGVAQPWAEAGFEGYAVSGPSQILGHTACRNIVVWVEPSGSKGRAINSRWCLMEGAVWARQKENAPIDLLPPAFVAED